MTRCAVLGALVLWCALAGGGCAGTAHTGAPDGRDGGLIVAAASDLRPAFEELGPRFTARSGIPVTFAFGSSGRLAQQIENGAPFDVFASADVAYVDRVIAAGAGDERTKRTYAFGRIVIWSDGAPHPDLKALADPSIAPVAVANPAHAPYGVAAVTALRRAGVYDVVAPRLVYGENVSDTLRLASSGNADAAIVALSLAIASDGGWTLIDESLHDPLEQALVVTAPPERAAGARGFADFIGGPEGRRVMRRYGFLLPGDPAPATAGRR